MRGKITSLVILIILFSLSWSNVSALEKTIQHGPGDILSYRLNINQWVSNQTYWNEELSLQHELELTILNVDTEQNNIDFSVQDDIFTDKGKQRENYVFSQDLTEFGSYLVYMDWNFWIDYVTSLLEIPEAEGRPSNAWYDLNDCEFSITIFYSSQGTFGNQTTDYNYYEGGAYSIDTGNLIYYSSQYSEIYENGTEIGNAQYVENTMNYYCDSWDTVDDITNPFDPESQVDQRTIPTLSNNLPGFLSTMMVLALIPGISYRKYTNQK